MTFLRLDGDVPSRGFLVLSIIYLFGNVKPVFLAVLAETADVPLNKPL